MSRTVSQWIGKNDDEKIPARVRVRIFDRCGGRCMDCGVKISGSIRPEFDHVVALCLGGGNIESNVQLLCHACHGAKSRGDIATKATVYRKKLKHLGLKPKGRPFPGSKSSNVKMKIGGGWEYRK